MPRPSRKKVNDEPTNAPEDLACQGKLPRNTTVAEDVMDAPRSAAKHVKDFGDDDGDTKNHATPSKGDEVKSEKLTRKKRDAPSTVHSENRRGAPRSSRKRAGDFNDFDGGNVEAVAVPDTPTGTTSAKPSKKRKTAKTTDNTSEPNEAVDRPVETEKVFPGGDRVEVEIATRSKPGRKQVKKTEKAENPPVESAKPVGKSKSSKKDLEKPLDSGGEPNIAGDKDEEVNEATKDTPKRRGRPKKAKAEPESAAQTAKSTRVSKKTSNEQTLQKPLTTGKGKKAATKGPGAEESATKEAAAKEPATEEPVIKEAVQQPSKSNKGKKAAAKGPATKEPVASEPAADEPATKETVQGPSKASKGKKVATKGRSTKEAATEEPAVEEPAAVKNTSKSATTSKGKRAATKGPVPDETAVEEAATKEAPTEEVTQTPAKTSKGRKPAAKSLPTKESANEEPVITEPATADVVEKHSKTSRGKKPAVKESATHDSAAKEPAKEPATEATIQNHSKPSRGKRQAVKSSALHESGAEEPATNETTTEKPALKEPTAEKPAAKKPTTEKPPAAEPAPKKPTSRVSRRANEEDKVEQPADPEVAAKPKSSKGRKPNKASDVAETSGGSSNLKTSKEPSASAIAAEYAKEMELDSGEPAGSSREADTAVASKSEHLVNDGVSSGASKTNKRKTPPGADSDAIREILDPLSDHASTKKKQKKGLTQSLEDAKTTLGDIVAPIVETVTHGIHTAKDITTEVAGSAPTSILEDVTTVAEEAVDTNVGGAERPKDVAEPAAKEARDEGTKKGKERAKSATEEVEPGQSSAKGAELGIHQATSGTTTQHQHEYEQHYSEKTDQTSAILAGSNSGDKELTGTHGVPEEQSHRPYQSTILEVTGTTTVYTNTTVVQDGGEL